MFQVIGFSGLFIVILLAVLTSSCKCCGCCYRPSYSKFCCSNKKEKFEKLILEEEENILTEALREAVKVQLKEKVEAFMEQRQWEKSIDVADELIREQKKVYNWLHV